MTCWAETVCGAASSASVRRAASVADGDDLCSREIGDDVARLIRGEDRSLQRTQPVEIASTEASAPKVGVAQVRCVQIGLGEVALVEHGCVQIRAAQDSLGEPAAGEVGVGQNGTDEVGGEEVGAADREPQPTRAFHRDTGHPATREDRPTQRSPVQQRAVERALVERDLGQIEVATVETRYLLELPVASTDTPLDAPLDTPLGTPLDTDIEIVGWVGPCPLQYEAQLLLLQQQMEQDVPRGELSRRPLDLDLERQRDNQRRLAERGWTSVTALAMVNGESVGYTEVLVQDRDRVMVQEDTLVLPAHRGRRIGQALKADNLRRLDGVRDGRTMLQTFIADSNAAMRATNAKFGFQAADVLYECEGRI